MEIVSNSEKNPIYLFILVGLFQKTKMTDGCQAFQESEWVIRSDVLPLGGDALVEKREGAFEDFAEEG